MKTVLYITVVLILVMTATVLIFGEQSPNHEFSITAFILCRLFGVTFIYVAFKIYQAKIRPWWTGLTYTSIGSKNI